jgi:hypothetical protein
MDAQAALETAFAVAVQVRLAGTKAVVIAHPPRGAGGIVERRVLRDIYLLR